MILKTWTVINIMDLIIMNWDNLNNVTVDVSFDDAEVTYNIGVIEIYLSVNNKLKSIAAAKYDGSIEAAIKDIVDSIADDLRTKVSDDTLNLFDIYVDEAYEKLQENMD